MNFLQWNCCIITPEKNKLIHYIEGSNIDVVTLDETWFFHSDNFSFSGTILKEKMTCMAEFS